MEVKNLFVFIYPIIGSMIGYFASYAFNIGTLNSLKLLILCSIAGALVGIYHVIGDML